jgi:hypothetical protein
MYDLLASHDIGGKKSQEDYVVCISNMSALAKNCRDNIQRSYFAVFDGTNSTELSHSH